MNVIVLEAFLIVTWQTPPSSTSPAGQDGINTALLHPFHPPVPVRSPVRTRVVTSKHVQKNQDSSGVNSGTQQKQPSTTVNITTSNTYTPLSGDEDGDDDDDVSISSVDDDDDDDDGSTSKSKKRSSARTTAAKEKKTSADICCRYNVDELLEGHEYCLKIGKTTVQVITLSKKNFDKVIMVLKMHNVKFYTFEPAQNTPVKVVLTGYIDRPIADLTEHLADVGINPRDIKVLSKTTTVIGTHVLYILYFDRGYCAKSLVTVPYSHPDYAPLKVLSRYLSSKYLLPVVREQNGAYGAGAKLASDGLFNFFSYRDPNSRLTLETFDRAHQWTVNTAMNDQTLFEAKLGVLQQLDVPVAPIDRGMDQFRQGISEQRFDLHREEVLAVGKEQLGEVSERYLKPGAVKVVGRSVLGPENEGLRKEGEKWSVFAL